MPPTTKPSSLQSNWNASPGSNVNGTKACGALPALPRHARMNAVSWLYPPV
jgi:hypothetical protein